MVRKSLNLKASQADTGAPPYPLTPMSPTEESQRKSSDEKSLADVTTGTYQNPQSPKITRGSNPWRKIAQRGAEEGLPALLKVGEPRRHDEYSTIEGLPSVPQAGSAEATPRSSWESQRSVVPNPSNHPFPVKSSSNLQTLQPSQVSDDHQWSHDLGLRLPEHAGFNEESSADVWGHNTSFLPTEPTQQDQRQISHLFSDYDAPSTADGVFAPEPSVEQSTNQNIITPQRTTPSTRNVENRPGKAFASSGKLPEIDESHHPSGVVYRSSNYSTTAQNGDHSQLESCSDQNSFGASMDTGKVPLDDLNEDDVAPALPPRTLQEMPERPPPQPPRPQTINGNLVNDVDIQAKQAESAKNKRARETYQIRHVNWYDASSHTNPRRSPIMVQNANGPCPLLALVNALVLSTPADYATALVETLRVREQVSLGLLIDAVIDELIGRNGDLPDVTEMYAFLVTLHTGMNVNPRFIPPDTAINLMDSPIDREPPGNLQDFRQAGSFEDTREMKLYSTFAIPLIHGWIPPRNHPACAALKRSAKTYEDAQNLMFREEELESKLQRQGLIPEEQLTLEDIGSIRYYLSSTATQLTGYGLDTMSETMRPGSVAILFRNDHFSTLYKHPKSGQLLTLVTDMGYAGHDEVVWESLVDVSGEGSEFFSGDFRPVGNVVNHSQLPSQSPDEDGWTAVKHRSRRPVAAHRKVSSPNLPPLSTLNVKDEVDPLSPSAEQEDHDLALAMQLQEEEEERDRQEAAARRREDELSQAYLNNSDASGRRTFPGFSSGATGAQGGPSPPPRGRGSGQGPRTSRPTPPRKSVDAEDAPPPTYEQAAKGPAYHPPAQHPSSPYAGSGPAINTTRPLPARPRQSSAYSEHANSYNAPASPYGPARRGHNPRASCSGPLRGGGIDPGLTRRRSGVPGSVVSSEDDKRDRDCIMM